MGPVSIQVTLKRGNSLGLCPFSSYFLHMGLPTPSLPGWPGHSYRGPPIWSWTLDGLSLSDPNLSLSAASLAPHLGLLILVPFMGPLC